MADEMSGRLAALIRDVEDVLVAGHGLLHDLLAYHEKAGTVMPPFIVQSGDLGVQENRRTALADALRAYGGQPGPLFNLWSALSAMDRLRTTWLGR